MKLHILYCALLGLFLLGCKKDFKSSTATYIHNSSSVAIELYPYQAGALVRENILMILPNEKREIYRDNPWGKTIQPSWPSIAQFYDSVVIVFDGNYSVRHLVWSSDTFNCNKCLSFDNVRNVTNEINYEQTITKKHRKYLDGYFDFTITEADYEYAKD